MVEMEMEIEIGNEVLEGRGVGGGRDGEEILGVKRVEERGYEGEQWENIKVHCGGKTVLMFCE